MFNVYKFKCIECHLLRGEASATAHGALRINGILFVPFLVSDLDPVALPDRQMTFKPLGVTRCDLQTCSSNPANDECIMAEPRRCAKTFAKRPMPIKTTLQTESEWPWIV